MNFASALFSLKRGFKIKRHDWIGYWVLEDNKVMIHLKNGHVMNLVDSDDIIFTLENMACDDWEVITDSSNVGLPKCPSDTINVKDGYPSPNIYPTKTYPSPNQNHKWYEDLKVKTNDNTTLKSSSLTEDFDRRMKMCDSHCIPFENPNNCYPTTNDDGIYAPSNDQNVNDSKIYSAPNTEPVNDTGIYEKRSKHSSDSLDSVQTTMNAIKVNPEYMECKNTYAYNKISQNCQPSSYKFDDIDQIPTDDRTKSTMLKLHTTLNSILE